MTPHSCINRLEAINSGSIWGSGIAPGKYKERLYELWLKIGIILQQFNLFPHLTAGCNIMPAQRIVRKRTQAEAKAIVEATLTKAGLPEKLDRHPDEHSGGQQQRVAIEGRSQTL